jgi:predicted nucleotidyltransferase
VAFLVNSFINKHLMTLIDTHIADIRKLCANHHVRELYAFGSVLTNNFTTKSDIDLVVAFDQIDISLYADNYFDFKFSLQNILKRPADLLEDKAIKNPYFIQNLKQQRQLIYGH